MLLLSNLAYVAAEKTDGFWGDNLHIFDKTTSILMLRKTGGFVTDKESGSDIFRKKNIIAGNEHIRLKLEKTLKKGLNFIVF